MTDTQPRLVCLEIWRPREYVGSHGPHVFWRECLPVHVPPSCGWRMNERGERVPQQNAAKIVWAQPSDWRVMDKDFARAALSQPNPFFTLDQFPGVTFVVRKVRDVTEKDWEAIRALRVAANVPRPTCAGCKQEIDPDTCGCGDSRESHTMGSGHGFVPMGCNCYRV